MEIFCPRSTETAGKLQVATILVIPRSREARTCLLGRGRTDDAVSADHGLCVA
jgi:hypothetical protein